MQVGALTETITVTGESPLVDTRNVRKQTVVSADLLNVLPSSVKNLNNLVALTPGFRGNEGFDVTGAYSGQIGATFHGKGGTNVQFDGMGIQHASGNQGYNANAETVQELVMSTSGISADSNADGAIVNMIPKEGGNQFAGSVSGLFSNDNLMSDNLSDELIARGLKSVNRLNYIYDAGLHAGWTDQEGPVLVLRLVPRVGQQAAGGQQVLQRHAAHAVLHAGPHAPGLREGMVRVESHSPDLAGDGEEQDQLLRRSAARLPLPGADGERLGERAGSVLQLQAQAGRVSIRSPGARRSTSKLLLEAGVGRADGSWPIYRQPEVTRDDISIVEQSTGVRYNSGTPTSARCTTRRSSCRASASASPRRTSPAATISRRVLSSRRATWRSRPRTAPTTWSTRSTTGCLSA